MLEQRNYLGAVRVFVYRSAAESYSGFNTESICVRATVCEPVLKVTDGGNEGKLLSDTA